MTVAVTN